MGGEEKGRTYKEQENGGERLEENLLQGFNGDRCYRLVGK